MQETLKIIENLTKKSWRFELSKMDRWYAIFWKDGVFSSGALWIRQNGREVPVAMKEASTMQEAVRLASMNLKCCDNHGESNYEKSKDS